jgi:nucleotide-binding universal stress UspA family protein
MPQMEFLLIRAVKPIVPVFAIPEPPFADREAHRLADQIETMQKEMEREAAAYLERVAARLRERGLQVQTHVVFEDQPAQAILHEAEMAALT